MDFDRVWKGFGMYFWLDVGVASGMGLNGFGMHSEWIWN